MPDRDDGLIWIEELKPPYVRFSWSHLPWPNQTRVRRHVEALTRKYASGWTCAQSGDLMPVWKRVDAKYCKESCREMAAQKRRVFG